MCYRCFWPKSLCWCGSIHPMATRTKIVILIHPKEWKEQRTGTGRLTHLCLADSELIMGVDFDTDERPCRITQRADQAATRDTSTGVLVQCVCGRCGKTCCITLRTHLDGLQLFVSSD